MFLFVEVVAPRRCHENIYICRICQRHEQQPAFDQRRTAGHEENESSSRSVSEKTTLLRERHFGPPLFLPQIGRHHRIVLSPPPPPIAGNPIRNSDTSLTTFVVRIHSYRRHRFRYPQKGSPTKTYISSSLSVIVNRVIPTFRFDLIHFFCFIIVVTHVRSFVRSLKQRREKGLFVGSTLYVPVRSWVWRRGGRLSPEP